MEPTRTSSQVMLPLDPAPKKSLDAPAPTTGLLPKPRSTPDTTYTKVFVGGLAWTSHSETLSDYFKQFGEIDEAVVIMDRSTGRSKGYGFVTFAESSAAANAVANQYPTIDGRKANCNLAAFGAKKKQGRSSRDDRNDYNRNLPPREKGQSRRASGPASGDGVTTRAAAQARGEVGAGGAAGGAAAGQPTPAEADSSAYNSAYAAAQQQHMLQAAYPHGYAPYGYGQAMQQVPLFHGVPQYYSPPAYYPDANGYYNGPGEAYISTDDAMLMGMPGMQYVPPGYPTPAQMMMAYAHHGQAYGVGLHPAALYGDYSGGGGEVYEEFYGHDGGELEGGEEEGEGEGEEDCHEGGVEP